MATPLYLNHLQWVMYHACPRSLMALFGRRFGKTAGVLAPYAHRAQMSMPQGGGCFVGNSKAQILMRTLPALVASWASMFGIFEGRHWCWGKPPKALGYPSPFIKPRSWENELSFCNGFIWHLISMGVVGSANGITSCVNIGDEAKYWSPTKLKEEVEPTLSGIIDTFGRYGDAFTEANPFYKGRCYVSDAPLSQNKNWMEKEEKRLDDTIEFGPHAGRTNRECQQELVDYAERVIYFDTLLYRAKKTEHKVMVVSREKREQIRLLADQCQRREGRYHILSHPGVNRQNVTMLVSYKVIAQEDAELLYNHEFLITQAEYLELQQYQHNEKYQAYIKELRCATWGYFRGSTLDNIDIVSPQYISEMKKVLSPMVFAVSILNQRITKTSDGFYFALDIENLHGYVPGDCPAIEQNYVKKTVSNVVAGREYKAEVERPDFERLSTLNDCTRDGDLDMDAALHISIDINAKICWLGVGQLKPDMQRGGMESLYVINSLFVKDGERMHALCRNFNRYYRPKIGHNRTVHFYFDQTNKRNENYAIEGQTDPAHVVIKDLTDAGWDVVPHDMGNPPRHEEKYEVINMCLQGYEYPFIRINRENNEELIIALENTGIQQGYNGFRKDKSGEKLAYNPEGEGSGDGVGKGTNTPYELRSDVTDMFDNLVYGVKFHQNSVLGLSMPVVV